jgi:Circularly permutated YpsA SLOG family
VLRKIVSGGQTGADRAGLDFAIEAGIEHGAFVPRGLESVSFAVESDSKAFESQLFI